MDTREDLKRRIEEIEDRIRQAPQDTPHKIVFDWYVEIDQLKDQYRIQDELYGPLIADESNMIGISNADIEERATDRGREDFMDQWNRGSGKPESWSQIVGNAKEEY